MEKIREKISLKREASGTYHRWGCSKGTHIRIPAGNYFMTARFDASLGHVPMVQLAVDLGNNEPSVKHIYRLTDEEFKRATS